MNSKERSDLEKLIELVIDLNLSIPVNISNELNRKTNAIEKQLKSMGINPRTK